MLGGLKAEKGVSGRGSEGLAAPADSAVGRFRAVSGRERAAEQFPGAISSRALNLSQHWREGELPGPALREVKLLRNRGSWASGTGFRAPLLLRSPGLPATRWPKAKASVTKCNLAAVYTIKTQAPVLGPQPLLSSLSSDSLSSPLNIQPQGCPEECRERMNII